MRHILSFQETTYKPGPVESFFGDVEYTLVSKVMFMAARM
jgi:hypothetical protein